MIYLLLSILSSTLIFVIFKLANKFDINTLQLIVLNYITACILGIVVNNNTVSVSYIIDKPWFIGALILGILFIVIFNVMALTAQRNGISVASVATKMSVAIPIFFGIYMYSESHGLLKILGICLALVAVYLTSVKSSNLTPSIKELWLPIILFLGSGIIDTSIKYFQHHHLTEATFSIFSATIFFFAALIGITIIVFNYFKFKTVIKLRVLPAGFILGIVNFGSIYYLLKALDFENLDSSTVFSINNVAIVLVSTIVGLLLFKEKIFIKNWIGIALSVISILLIAATI